MNESVFKQIIETMRYILVEDKMDYVIKNPNNYKLVEV